MGEWEIEPAELHRVYLPVAAGVTRTVTPDAEATVELLLLRQELAAQAEQLTSMQEEREREQREKDRQLTALLTDQRVKGEEERANAGAINRWLSWLRTLR
jgi:hypothetical protein